MAHYVSVVAGNEDEARTIAYDNGIETLHQLVHHEPAQEPEEGDTFVFETADDVTEHDDYDNDMVHENYVDLAIPEADAPLLII